MKKGTCPKCGSPSVYRVKKRYPEPHGLIGVTLWSCVTVDDYICGACGFIETYLSDMSDLERVKKKASTT